MQTGRNKIMSLILPQEVETKVNGSIIKYYEELGYNMPRVYNDKTYKTTIIRDSKINVHVLDLKIGSTVIVKVQCDICGKVIDLSYAKYNINIDRNNGLYKCNDSVTHAKLESKNELNKLIINLREYLIKYNKFPRYNEFTKENKFEYCYATAESICKSNNTCLKDVFCSIDCFKSSKPSIKYYDTYLNKLIEAVKTSDLGVDLYRLSKGDNCKKYSLPNIRWFIENCPDNTVSDLSSFKKWAGLFENYLSKEECEEIIIKISKEFNRPLMYDDFRGTGYGFVSISMINKYWGSLNKMKVDLGLEIIQESMTDKQLSEKETITQIQMLCNYIKNDGRDFTTTREIDSLSNSVTSGTLRRMITKYFDMSLPKYFEQFGIHMGEVGRGLSFDFNDGEHATSQFEYMFSRYLRDYGLIYNKDYFRDVRYKNFISDYDGMMNCDYTIHIKGKIVYIEIAGIIEAYKNWYYGNRPITVSKSKEKYRLKLKEKEQMLKENNLIYFMLFPCDLTRDIFMQIITNGSLELKNNLEKFMKNNINWVKIQDVGELKYKENETSRSGQLVVDYQI